LAYANLQRIERIRENPATTTGAFTRKECANRGAPSYAFVVDGETHLGDGASEAGGDCDDIRIGAPIVVHYEKGNPANNTGGDPAEVLAREIIFVILTAVFLPVAAMKSFLICLK
jgi:hypothetical protein